MTIAFGVSCSEGVVLATDSMRSTWLNGWPTHHLTGEKFLWLNERTPYLRSGMFVELAEPSVPVDVPLRDVVELLFTVAESAAVTPPDGGRGGAHLMAAGSPQGIVPSLALFRTARQPCEAADGAPAVLVGGCMDEWAEQRGLHGGPVPATIAEAVDLAIESCRTFIAEVYASCGYTRLEDFPGFRRESGGLYPGVAFPLHLLTITRSEIKRLEVSQ